MNPHKHRPRRSARTQRGVTLVELVATAAISLVIVAGLSNILQVTADSKTALEQQNELLREASFAMQRIVRTVSHSRQLLLPLADKTWSNWPEHIREETFPASPPVGSSTLATAVLAVTLPAYVDLNFDGIPDADNDGDGRIDEDADDDWGFDNAPGIPFIDDGGDGTIDNGSYSFWDDDESSDSNEDPLDGFDNDADNNIDEDAAADMNGDGCPGLCGVDDDADGAVDEGSSEDDDEDGSSNEDWYDTVVFSLNKGVLEERMPVPWDESGGGLVSGLDFIISNLADGVTRLRFERVADSPPGWVLVDITLELTGNDDQIVSLNRRVRVGGAL